MFYTVLTKLHRTTPLGLLKYFPHFPFNVNCWLMINSECVIIISLEKLFMTKPELYCLFYCRFGIIDAKLQVVMKWFFIFHWYVEILEMVNILSIDPMFLKSDIELMMNYDFNTYQIWICCFLNKWIDSIYEFLNFNWPCFETSIRI